LASRLNASTRARPPDAGGCEWQTFDYAAQLAFKHRQVVEALAHIGGLDHVVVTPILGMADPWRYRNKVQQPVGWDPALRRMISGFYAAGSHQIVDFPGCPVQPEISVRIVLKAKELAAEGRWPIKAILRGVGRVAAKSLTTIPAP